MMKQSFLIGFLCIFVFSLQATNNHRNPGPLLVVVLMVKNEQAVIKQTLQMYCNADPRGESISYLIYDTGDEAWSPTMAKAQELFDEYQLTNYFILQEPFIDFATSRNRALRLAEEKFPHASFFLMPDAEWYLQGVEELLQFCEQQIEQTFYNAYLILLQSPELVFHVPRLIRAHSGVCFKGVVHECLKSNIQTGMGPAGVYFEYPDEPKGLQASKKRWLRDRDLLLKEYEKNPNDSRNLFYLAQTYDCLDDFENASYYYSKRTLLHGFVEEDYMAHYRLGYAMQRMMETDASIVWQEVVRHYLDAYLLRPTRAEPLIRISHFYFKNQQYDLAFLYAYLACKISYPGDILFIEKFLYDTVRYELFTKSAMHTSLEMPKNICIEAMERHLHEIPLEKYILSQVLPV